MPPEIWRHLFENVWFTFGVSVLTGILGEIGFRYFYKWFRDFTESTETEIDNLLLARMHYPMRIAVWLGAVLVFLHWQPQFSTSLIRKVIDVVEVGLILYIIVETLETLGIDYLLVERRQVDIPWLLRDIARVLIFSILGIVLIQNVFGADLTPFLATSTVISVVLGLALQSTLGNLFAGIALHLERPLRLGDWILYRTFEGKVVQMGWRSVTLQTFDGDLVTVPNHAISTADVVNFYAPTKLHARKLRILVKHQVSPEMVEKAVALAVEQVPQVLKDQPIKVWLVEYSPVAIQYTIKFWIEDFAFHDDIESHLMKQFWHAFAKLGLEHPLAVSVLLPTTKDEWLGIKAE